MAEAEELSEYGQQVKLCKDCGKEIKFIRNNYTGKPMPVDIKPLKLVTPEGHVLTYYHPHWENKDCPGNNKN
jgi:hypothetical protein